VTRPERGLDRPDRRAVLGSIAVHAVALIVVFLTTALRPEPPVFIIYEMDIVSPDALEEGELTPPAPEEELVLETPDEPEPEPEEEIPELTLQDEITPDPEPVPDEPIEREEPEPEEVPVEEEVVVATSPDPDPTEENPGADINVRMEGLQRDYPAYFENIVLQMRRCFRPPQGSTARATLQFVIRSDGSVDDIRVVEGSGDAAFDLIAMGAVECAGRGRFGPLPAEMPFEAFPVRFKFDPSGIGGGGMDLPVGDGVTTASAYDGPMRIPAEWETW